MVEIGNSDIVGRIIALGIPPVTAETEWGGGCARSESIESNRSYSRATLFYKNGGGGTIFGCWRGSGNVLSDA